MKKIKIYNILWYICLFYIALSILIRIICFNIYHNNNTLEFFINMIIPAIIFVILTKKIGKIQTTINEKLKLIIVEKHNHYFKLFLESIIHKNVGKAEYFYDHFLKNTKYEQTCNGIILGMRLNSNSKFEREHGLRDLHDLLNEL